MTLGSDYDYTADKQRRANQRALKWERRKQRWAFWKVPRRLERLAATVARLEGQLAEQQRIHVALTSGQPNRERVKPLEMLGADWSEFATTRSGPTPDRPKPLRQPNKVEAPEVDSLRNFKPLGWRWTDDQGVAHVGYFKEADPDTAAWYS